MFREFRKFLSKRNIMDLAIGVVVGGAFQKIINSLVEDIIMPCISILIGKIDFADMVVQIGGASIRYGKFIVTAVNFLIIAFSIFLVVRYLNKLNDLKYKNINKFVDKFDKTGKLKKFRKQKEDSEPDTKICPYCFSEINYKATRCPNCTSELSLNEDDNTNDENVNSDNSDENDQ
jgi:large conductance mechanosensitive channel